MRRTLVAQFQARLDAARRTSAQPKPLVVLSGTVHRDFAVTGASGEGLNVILIQMRVDERAARGREVGAEPRRALEAAGLSG